MRKAILGFVLGVILTTSVGAMGSTPNSDAAYGKTVNASESTGRRIAHGKSIYELWRTWRIAPLSLTFRHHCIQTEDFGGHLKLMEWSRSHVVFSCERRSH
jgi:hypothetical protein